MEKKAKWIRNNKGELIGCESSEKVPRGYIFPGMSKRKARKMIKEAVEGANKLQRELMERYEDKIRKGDKGRN